MGNIAKFTIGFTLLALPLFGWGCTEDIPTPSVSEKSDTVQADANEPASNEDEKPATKSSGKDDVTAPSQQSSLPEGWKWYESKQYKIKFGYPGDWYVREDVKLGILLTETPLPQPLPPDVLDMKVVMNVSEVNEEQILAALRDEDVAVTVETIQINGHTGKVYKYTSGPDAEPVISYRFPDGEHFIVLSADGTIEQPFVQSLLATLSF